MQNSRLLSFELVSKAVGGQRRTILSASYNFTGIKKKYDMYKIVKEHICKIHCCQTLYDAQNTNNTCNLDCQSLQFIIY